MQFLREKFECKRGRIQNREGFIFPCMQPPCLPPFFSRNSGWLSGGGRSGWWLEVGGGRMHAEKKSEEDWL